MQQKLKEISMTCKYFRNLHSKAKYQDAREMHEDLVIILTIGFRLDQVCDDKC